MKEAPAKKILPDNLKNILDMTDVHVEARANSSKTKDQTSFPVSWTIVFASNGEVQTDTSNDTLGLSDKIVEIRPPFLFVAERDERRPSREAGGCEAP